MPAWAYERIIADLPKPAQPLLIKPEGTVETSKQIWEYMLCGDCELRFCHWEDYASRVLVQEDGTFPWLAGSTPRIEREGKDLRFRDSSNLDTETLSLFAASVFWRASVSRMAVPGLTLGCTYDEQFRKYLTGAASFPANAVLVTYLHEPPKTDLPSADRTFTLPVQKRNSGYSCHKFSLCGALFHLFVGGRIPPTYEMLCLVKTKGVCSRPSDRFMADLGPLVMNSPPKAGYARKLQNEP